MHLVPKPAEHIDMTKRVHWDMGHHGVRRVLDCLQKKHWWKGMDATLAQVVKACMPCSRSEAGFRFLGNEFQPLALQGLMFRSGFDFAGALSTATPLATGTC